MRYLMTNLPLSLGEEKKDVPRLLATVLGGQPEDYRESSLERGQTGDTGR